jgi:hypothetical protein
MLKKALIIVIAVIGLLSSVVLMFRDEAAVSSSAAQSWPGEMGSLKAANNRWPVLEANDASVKLKSLADALPKNEAVDGFVAREIVRGELTIGAPPALPDNSAIRDLLLREPIIWQRHDEIGDQEGIAMRAMQMTLARSLVASALAKARANDPAAWDDLQAVWKLALTLEGHPQMMAQTAALSMARMINAVAWKMPLPTPAWLGELQTHDHVQTLLESFQHQTAYYWGNGARIFPTKWLAASIEHDRLIAEDLFNVTKCDVTTPMNELGTDLSSVWRRAFRYRAEREAAANALRVREGKSIDTGSRCSDGGWTFDGTTLRFSREIPTAAPDTPMPLVLQVKP